MAIFLLDANTLIYLAKPGGSGLLDSLSAAGMDIRVTDVVRNEATLAIAKPDARSDVLVTDVVRIEWDRRTNVKIVSHFTN